MTDVNKKPEHHPMFSCGVANDNIPPVMGSLPEMIRSMRRFRDGLLWTSRQAFEQHNLLTHIINNLPFLSDNAKHARNAAQADADAYLKAVNDANRLLIDAAEKLATAEAKQSEHDSDDSLALSEPLTDVQRWLTEAHGLLTQCILEMQTLCKRLEGSAA